MKKFMICILSVILTLTVLSPAFGAEHETDESVKLGEIQHMIEEYFKENGIDMEVESLEFYAYTIEQLLGEGDSNLRQLKRYDLIVEYMSEFKNTYGDYIICKNILNQENDDKTIIEDILEENDCITYSEKDNSIKFSLSNTFKNKTIGDIIQRNSMLECDYREITSTNDISPLAIASYSPSKAVNYANINATGWNVLYPRYINEDCTNFVSQCLKAGGLPMAGSNSKTGIYSSKTKWYCICTESVPGTDKGRKYAVTTSWIRVPDFNAYLTPKAKSKTKKTSASKLISSCSVGDVVQKVTAAGTPQHTVIITKKANGKAYYSAHSRDVLNESVSQLFKDGCSVLLFDLT